MANFISFDEGQATVLTSGLPSTCQFDLSTKSIDATSAYTEATTYSGRGVITGTGYAAQTQSRPSATGGTVTFSQMSWSTSSATDWSSTCRSVVLHNGGTIIAAWNLQTGGGARDMSQANTTESFTPTLVLSG